MSTKKPNPQELIPAFLGDPEREGLTSAQQDLREPEYVEKLPDLADEEDTEPGPFPSLVHDFDSYEQGSEPARVATGSAAPELSQGAWRERAFLPRGTMPGDQVLAELGRALKLASMQVGKELEATRVALKTEWMPFLRQAVEQAGGDGLDALLSKLLAPPGKPAKDRLVSELSVAMKRVEAAPSLSLLLAEGKRVYEAVRRALRDPEPKKISFKWLERELEGRIEIDALLAIVWASDDELAQRLDHVESTLEGLRAQLRGLPGAQPSGMFSNFARLKVEKTVVEAEQRRRSLRG